MYSAPHDSNTSCGRVAVAAAATVQTVKKEARCRDDETCVQDHHTLEVRQPCPQSSAEKDDILPSHFVPLQLNTMPTQFLSEDDAGFTNEHGLYAVTRDDASDGQRGHRDVERGNASDRTHLNVITPRKT